jgi:RNA polymerase sigma-70 factor (ECF subfamily)
MQNKSEPELIAQSLNGDHDAYAELINRYKNALYYHCFAIVKDEAASQDLAQETFVTAFYSLGRYNDKYRLSTWLFKISTNKCLNYLKKRSKEYAAEDKIIQSIASPHKGPAAEYADSELHEAVEALKPQYRAVISLYYWQGLSYQETAQAMGAPINSVRVWLKRAKQELRKELS